MIYALIRKRELEKKRDTFSLIKRYCGKSLPLNDVITQTLLSKKDITDLNKAVFKKLHTGDQIVVSEFSTLGHSSTVVVEFLTKLVKAGIIVHSVSDDITIGGRKSDVKIQLKFLSIFKNIEESIIKDRIKRGMARKKNSGVKLGRPKGSKSVKKKLTGRENEIMNLVNNNVSVSAIARIHSVNRVTMKSFINSVDLSEDYRNR